MLIAYTYSNEVLICSDLDEETMLHEWFRQGGRDPEDYDREEYLTVVRVSSRTRCEGD